MASLLSMGETDRGTRSKLRLTQGIARACQQTPHRTAIIAGDEVLTCSRFADRVARMAARLCQHGLRRGDRVAIVAESSARYLEAYFATLWAGGIIAPVNTRFAMAEMAEMLRDCAPALMLHDALFAPQAQSLAAGLPTPPGLLRMDAPLEEVPPMADAGAGGDDIACLFYTGGTTGRAKGVALSHANLALNALNISSHLGLNEEMVHLHCGPLFHLGAGARVFATTFFGGTHVVMPRFDARAVLETIARTGVTHVVIVPTMAVSLLGVPDFAAHDLSSLKIMSYGAAPMPAALRDALMARLPGCGLLQSYGMTETSAVVTMLPPRWHDPARGKNHTAGRALAGIDLRIADAANNPVPNGTVGEIQVRGPTVMQGYWNQPELTARTIVDGWMKTGDAGMLDDDGFLTVVDRLKDMIISGGENVYSAEVENAIHDHPAVEECAVFGIPDAVWGEAVHAVVLPKPGQALTEAEVIAHCRARIAAYKSPKSVTIADAALPRSGANKILKSKLRLAFQPEAQPGRT